MTTGIFWREPWLGRAQTAVSRPIVAGQDRRRDRLQGRPPDPVTADFARIVEALDKVQALSFVSVTQAFNTTSSMGRLTLNVLLSFAQFEREVTGERIRDKIAASKAKGIWMGGSLPLGYDRPTDPVRRALVVNEPEAATVRLIFHKLLELGSTYAVQLWLADQNIRSKRWVTLSGRPMGGFSFSRGALTHILRNRTYLGDIPHKAVSYPGRHSAIIDRATFDAVQAQVAVKSRLRREHVPKAMRLRLAGKVFDSMGQSMEGLVHRAKSRTYNFYAAPVVPFGSYGDDEDDTIRRVPAAALEQLIIERCALLAPGIPRQDLDAEIWRIASRVEVHAAQVHLLLNARGLSALAGEPVGINQARARLGPGDQVVADHMHSGVMRIVMSVRLKVRGGRTWSVGPVGPVGPGRPRPTGIDRSLIRRLRAGHAILRDCGIVPDNSGDQLRFARGPKASSEMPRVRLAFLAPDIQAAVLTGAIAAGGHSMLTAPKRLPLCWADQREVLRSETAKNPA
jgi:site-specific DNA recombinase